MIHLTELSLNVKRVWNASMPGKNSKDGSQRRKIGRERVHEEMIREFYVASGRP